MNNEQMEAEVEAESDRQASEMIAVIRAKSPDGLKAMECEAVCRLVLQNVFVRGCQYSVRVIEQEIKR